MLLVIMGESFVQGCGFVFLCLLFHGYRDKAIFYEWIGTEKAVDLGYLERYLGREQIKENNNIIRNLTREYKKIEQDCLRSAGVI